ncbi:hypothetical protein [Pedobacter nyackensis]|uniref:DUF4136 domain-containing protein n=1 Tax=Pedobacter nyackensis TaxID=475255 RepID=A0A1W2DDJ0_9SPHI|nr:hypothetical protein [Pedobacter nyackensis]SMC95008.1 hypothetical protein SAMN04488101_106165 [Pedobacter nyackensis]
MKKLSWTGYFLLLLLMACSSTKITNWWKAENVAPVTKGKIMVIGLIKEPDRSIQQNIENQLVSGLQNLGYSAMSSLQEYGPKAFNQMNEEAALRKLRSSGVDAVLTIVLLNKQKERNYVAGNIYYSPYGYYSNRWWNYNMTLYNRIYEPGYYVVNTRYFWESNLFDLSTQKLLYSVQTQSFDPSTPESLGKEYGTLIIENMVKNGALVGNGMKR